MTSSATESGVDPAAFRPSADRYGATVGRVVRCLDCGHGSLAAAPSARQLAAAYAAAADPAAVAEEPGQLETARRSLVVVERMTAPGSLLDIGCWTGSLVLAAAERGWAARGVEPSAWAVRRAEQRGAPVRLGDVTDTGAEPGTLRCVAMCDVVEHLLEPGAAVAAAARLLEPGGVLYLTAPDAGSAVARLLGARWWSVLPMHVQYFTRASMQLLLSRLGLRVAAVASHPKVFTAGYYASRLAGYSPAAGRAAVAVSRGVGLADRLVAPDFRDRMQVVAVKA